MAIATESNMTAILDRGQQLARLEADLFPADRIDPDDAECDPALWPDWTDTDVWSTFAAADDDEATLDLADWARETDAREHLDASERLTLAELTDLQIAFYRGWNNAAGEMFAEALERLAVQIRLTDATTPDELEARVEILDADVREQWTAAGYADGRASCQGEPGPAFGHIA